MSYCVPDGFAKGILGITIEAASPTANQSSLLKEARSVSSSKAFPMPAQSVAFSNAPQ